MSEKGYIVEEWSGHEKFQCSSCSFDTLVEENIVVHVQKRHQPPRNTADEKTPSATEPQQIKTVATPLEGSHPRDEKKGGSK